MPGPVVVSRHHEVTESPTVSSCGLPGVERLRQSGSGDSEARRCGRADQAVSTASIRRAGRQFLTVADAELSVDPGQVLLHRGDRDVEAGGDLTVGVAQSGQRKPVSLWVLP